MLTTNWPRPFADGVCPTCGGTTRSNLSAEALVPLQKAITSAPPASVKLIQQRDEILSRALTDAKVAEAGDGASANISSDDTILGKYKIVRRLSEGGMAEVFLAKQVGIGGFEKPVALKRIQRKLLETRHLAIDMFLNEAKIAGRLTHPNIVQVLDVGEVGGALYLAMEYVHGKDLRDVIKQLQASQALMSIGEACYVVREVAQALHHAYWSTDLAGQRHSVVHRDVSPQNIILSYDGTVKLLDFGVAMSAVTEHEQSLVVGKWLYMAPEATTKEPIDHRSDLFSLGVIFYLLLSGYMPFSGREPKEIVQRIRAGEFARLEEFAPHVPAELAALVARMLSPNPADRPQRGQEIVTELTEIARHYGFESSGPSIATYLAQLFAEDVPAGPDLSLTTDPGTDSDGAASSKTIISPPPVALAPPRARETPAPGTAGYAPPAPPTSAAAPPPTPAMGAGPAMRPSGGTLPPNVAPKVYVPPAPPALRPGSSALPPPYAAPPPPQFGRDVASPNLRPAASMKVVYVTVAVVVAILIVLYLVVQPR